MAAQLLDPTKPQNDSLKGKVVAPAAKLQLQTVIKNGRTYKAIISGQVYMLGDVIDGYKVLTITASSVTLANDLKQIKLDLYDYDIKK